MKEVSSFISEKNKNIFGNNCVMLSVIAFVVFFQNCISHRNRFEHIMDEKIIKFSKNR